MAENRGVLRVGGELVSFWCPGCDEAHTINAKGWAWDGNADAPTFSPSVLSGFACDVVYATIMHDRSCKGA